MAAALSHLVGTTSATELATNNRLLLVSRDEMNLAEFPLAVLSTRVDPKLKTLEFRDEQRLKNGEVMAREWIITAADKFGLPTATDDDVILALMRLSMNHGFRERKVFFTRYELLKILQWTTEGRSYSRLIKSFDRLSGVRIRATNAFYDNDSKSYQTCNFGIIDAYEINDSRGKASSSTTNCQTPKSFFTWSEVLFDSFKAGYIKKLNLELYFELSSAISRRLYRYLDKHFYYKSTFEKPLMVLAFEKLGLSRNYRYVSSVKQQLEPALEELVQKKFISHFDYGGHGMDTTLRIYAARPACGQVIDLRRSDDSVVEPKHVKPDDIGECVTGQKSDLLVRALVARGISQVQAINLLKNKSAADYEQVTKILQYYDYLVRGNDAKISRNKIGFLYRAIENSQKFILPKSFDGSRQQLEKKKAEHISKVITSRKEEDLVAYRKYVESQVASYRKSMPESEVSEIYASLEKKMASLKPVLERSAFETALRGCLSDEIAKMAGVLDFRRWLINRNKDDN